MKYLLYFAIIVFLLLIFVNVVFGDEIKYGTASWYSVASVKKEGNSGVMANGEKLDDNKFTCAIWNLSFGSKLLVTNLTNKRSVEVYVTDRGPAKRFVKKGRIVDLSKKAFSVLAPLEQGIIEIKIEVIR